MANIIASGATELDSSEFTLTDGQRATLFITGTADANALASVKIKAADGTFSTIGMLTKSQPAMILDSAGSNTYKVTRAAAATAFGVDKN